jgi:hypothetical protein
MLRLAGWWWITVSALHALGGIILYFEQWQEISQAGWFNVVAPDPFAPIFSREAAFWFILLSPFIYLVGELCLWAHRQKLTLPIFIGIILLATMSMAVFLIPISGFWLGLPPTMMMLYSSKISQHQHN